MEDEKRGIKIILGEYFTDEDWLRAGRRRFLLLNIIYYLQHVAGKENGIGKDDLEEFLEVLRSINKELFSSIIKPKIPLEHTLRELLNEGLIVQNSEGKYLVNSEKIRDERDLIYWESVKRTLDLVWKKF